MQVNNQAQSFSNRFQLKKANFKDDIRIVRYIANARRNFKEKYKSNPQKAENLIHLLK